MRSAGTCGSTWGKCVGEEVLTFYFPQSCICCLVDQLLGPESMFYHFVSGFFGLLKVSWALNSVGLLNFWFILR